MKYTYTLLFALAGSLYLSAQLNTTLLGQLDYDVDVNDVWGYVAPDGTEYALLGLYDGVAVISLADPSNPVEVARTEGQNSNWRDMKTYGEYAYVVADQGNEGLTVLDLRGLPDTISYTNNRYRVPGFDRALVRAHNVYVDTEQGLLFTAGGDRNLNDGGILIFDVKQNPLAPPLLAVGPDTYSHDVFAQHGLMYASEIYKGELAVYDISDLANIQEVGRTSTPFRFTHNSWATDDDKTVFTTDERSNASVASFDLTDPTDIRKLDEYRPLTSLNTGTIPHNVHVIGDFLSISHYTDGLRVVDASDPANLIEVGNYDTWPGADGGFNGAWGAYPFLPSGLTLVSDRARGLFVIDVDYVRAARLAGKVTNAMTGAAVNGAQVTILSTRLNIGSSGTAGNYRTGVVLTDSAGMQTTPVGDGTYAVRISAPGYFDDTVSVRLVSGEEVLQDVELLPRILASIDVRLLDRATEAPITEGTLQLVADSLRFTGTTDTLARVTLLDIPNRSYRAIATAWGYLPTVVNRMEAVDLDQDVIYLDRGYADSFVSDLAWTTQSDTATGTWQLSNLREAELLIGDVQIKLDTQAYLVNLDSGRAVLQSPYFDLRDYADDATLSYAYFAAQAENTGQGELTVQLLHAADTVLLASYADGTTTWQRDSFMLTGKLAFTDSMQIQLTASSMDTATIFRAGFDDFSIRGTRLISSVGDDTGGSTRVSVFPNPSPAAFTLQLEDAKAQDHQLTVYRLSGQLVERRLLTARQQRIDLGASYPPGVYIVRLTTDGKLTTTLRMIKQ
ncbi:hypothetical protein LEM8419_01366 [Neolewinella maritima]|uniref:Secretion system C-terminal sorting domain-containing protein n=1 Tax=Neolewinella maritima TaxID=1383882 RepID=A0ABN8F7I0_9BACT|nr:choice-of-anchor B family protein [Neolewinella maritima]CAH1000218.1 hypothetical protein LEM8419_01366 [Neolewinella maritima]